MARIEDSIRIAGDKILAKKLKKLADTSARKVMRPAINAGLTPIRKRAIELAKANFKSDTIAKEIGKSAKKSRRGSGVVGKVFIKKQPNRTIKIKGKQVPFEVVANILEFGRKDGSLQARSFMRRAREEMGGQAIIKVREKALERLEIEWEKGKIRLK